MHKSFLMKLNFSYTLIGLSFLVSVFFLLQLDFSYLELIDHKKFRYVTYDDSGTGGISESSLKKGANVVCLSYTLKPSQDQYAGLKVMPIDNNTFIETNDYNQISITIQNAANRRLRLFQVTKVDTLIAKNGKHAYKGVAQFDGENNTCTVDLNKLETPEWWYRKNKIKDNQDYNRASEATLSFNIQDDALVEDGKLDNICVTSMRLTKNNWPIIRAAFLFPALIILFFTLFKKIKSTKKVIVSYVSTENSENISIDIKDKNLKLLVEFIALNYTNPDLDLKLIRRKVGITEQSVSQLLKNSFGVSYLDYVQNIRIQEAKRLFNEGNTYISEVAYKVGFGHISSFNRIFKKIEGITPTEFISNR
jgi:AraC-like DNA-binding protein